MPRPINKGATFVTIRVTSEAHRIIRAIAILRGVEQHEIVDEALKTYEPLLSALQKPINGHRRHEPKPDTSKAPEQPAHTD